MFMARIVIGMRPQVYRLVGSHEPCAWQFWQYQRAAAAKAETQLQAIAAARRELARRSENLTTAGT